MQKVMLYPNPPLVTTIFCICWRSHLDDVPGLHGQSGEVPAAVDRDALPQDGVQPPHLIPGQHADPRIQLRGITGGITGRITGGHGTGITGDPQSV